MNVRGIRGATTVVADEAEAIRTATKELFLEIIERNQIGPDDVASIFVTVTEDLHAAFPAQAIRTLPDWQLVPLIGSTEMTVEGAISHCIRLLLLINTNKKAEDMQHVYREGAKALRPDLSE